MKLSGFFLLFAAAIATAQDYDLVLRGGHVIDSKNNVSTVRDVGIRDGRIAAVAAKIDPAQAHKVVDVTGLYVTPGLVDIHVHVYTGTAERGSYAGDNSVYPDGFTFRSGVTTVADAGSSGWRNFEDFKDRIIDRSRTRVLAFLNIVGNGMRGGKYEQDLADMDAGATARAAMANRDSIIGVKCAHYAGPEWAPVERAVQAGTEANIPVMIDFGRNFKERPINVLLTQKLRPGDIYTHVYSGLRDELDDSGKPNQALFDGRKRGVIFDAGHGGGSFLWRVAVPAMKAGLAPDSISTDLHIGSMNAGMKDMLNVMSKFLNLGMGLDDVIRRSTWNPAKEIKREELGHLSVGAPADVAVLRLERGNFGFADSNGARMKGNQKLVCELTVRGGRVVWDLNAITREDWDRLPVRYGAQADRRWDAQIGASNVSVRDAEAGSRGQGTRTERGRRPR
ncbi:MAG TPA: amidohydrolase/deacetylase family metallohydrolase [Bryobacteraceae bacterium]|nr:amidohydrolase/deacetylase family metallohydrolase [Bryobacteraceae bacterium]